MPTPRSRTPCARYTTTATSSRYPGETRVDRFSPADGWRLVSINGEPPSPQALAEYVDDAKRRNRDRQRTFAVEPTTGASLVASMTFSMRGKAFVFRNMNTEARLVLSDYDCR